MRGQDGEALNARAGWRGIDGGLLVVNLVSEWLHSSSGMRVITWGITFLLTDIASDWVVEVCWSWEQGHGRGMGSEVRLWAGQWNVSLGIGSSVLGSSGGMQATHLFF